MHMLIMLLNIVIIKILIMMLNIVHRGNYHDEYHLYIVATVCHAWCVMLILGGRGLMTI